MRTISVHVDENTYQQVVALAGQLERSASWVAKDALKPYLAHRQWMVEETRKSLDEMRSGSALLEHTDVVKTSLVRAAKLDQ
jgi:predicted transcriptional regulator